MNFKARTGSTLTDEQAQRYGESIAAIVEEHGGRVKQQEIVDAAKSKTSMLHDYFAWDDAYAAQCYRLKQAGHLLRAIHIVIKTNGDEEEVRAFHNVFVKVEGQEDHERVYVQLERVLSEDDLRQQILEQALKQLRAWQRKYAKYKDAELAHIFAAIQHSMELVEV